jgi:hypothetical protein
MFDTHDPRNTADLALAAYLAAVIRTECGATADNLAVYDEAARKTLNAAT